MNKTYWYILGGVAIGAAGAVLLVRHGDKLKPAAAELVAKAMNLKEKALDYASRGKEHFEDVMAEARHINELEKRLQPEQAQDC